MTYKVAWYKNVEKESTFLINLDLVAWSVPVVRGAGFDYVPIQNEKLKWMSISLTLDYSQTIFFSWNQLFY